MWGFFIIFIISRWTVEDGGLTFTRERRNHSSRIWFRDETIIILDNVDGFQYDIVNDTIDNEMFTK